MAILLLLKIYSSWARSPLPASSAPKDSPSPFRPYLQWIFITFNLIVLGFIFKAKPLESLLGLCTLVIGAATYAWDRWQR
jgi:hypothetical protein